MEIDEKVLAKTWDKIDWIETENELAELQKKLTIAAFAKNMDSIEKYQKMIVRNLSAKCLAVRQVSQNNGSPGVDGIRWRTSAEKMKAAFSLTSKNYHCSPMRQIVITAKNSGKERRPQIPTYYDRAMSVLYGYALLPVVEAWGDKKSFAFRPNRSAHDAHIFIIEALEAKRSPSYAVCADIKSYYASIHHNWLMQHVPMDKRILREFLNAGVIFAGELFPAAESGISEGSSLSPILGNFVLDGLQKYIYKQLTGTETPTNFSNGNMIRFADDVLVTVESKEDAEKVVECLENFLDERGLRLSQEKTKICDVKDGFTFLSRTYVLKNGYAHSYPSEKAVERFISEITETILRNTKSQRDLIETVNRKLKGWAGYHRYTEATEAFHKIDNAVQAALIKAAQAKHPRLDLQKIISKYWYKKLNGEHVYALPDDKSVCIYKISDTILTTHNRIRISSNPFVDIEYSEERSHNREIKNVTGRYRAIWDRQSGKCYYCGRSILSDQPRTIVPLDLDKAQSLSNSAYVHDMCVQNELEVFFTEVDTNIMRPIDVYRTLEGITEHINENYKGTVGPKWRYYNLKQYFANCKAASVVLTFKQIEDIIEHKLPAGALKNKQYWYRIEKHNGIAESWLTEGYDLDKIDFEKKQISLSRREEGVSNLKIPNTLLSGKLPDNAVYELETFMDYIINKYALSKRK